MSKPLPQELIHDYVDDRLNETERLRVEAHLRQHEGDAEAVRQLRQLRTLLRKSRRHKLDDQFSQRVLTAIEQQPASSGQAVESSLTPTAVKSNEAVATAPSGKRMDWRIAAATIASLAAMLLLALIVVQKPDQQPVALGKVESVGAPEIAGATGQSQLAELKEIEKKAARSDLDESGSASDGDANSAGNDLSDSAFESDRFEDLTNEDSVMPKAPKAGAPESPSRHRAGRSINRGSQEKVGNEGAPSSAPPEGIPPRMEEGSRNRQSATSPAKDSKTDDIVQWPAASSAELESAKTEPGNSEANEANEANESMGRADELKSASNQRGGGGGQGYGGGIGDNQSKRDSGVVHEKRGPLDVVTVSTHLTADDLAAINEFSVAQAGEFGDGGIFSTLVPEDVDGADKKELTQEVQADKPPLQTLMFNVEATDAELEQLLAKIGGKAITRAQFPLEFLEKQRFAKETRDSGGQESGPEGGWSSDEVESPAKNSEKLKGEKADREDDDVHPQESSSNKPVTKNKPEGPVVESVPMGGVPTGDSATSKRKQFLLVVQLLPADDKQSGSAKSAAEKAESKAEGDSGSSKSGSETKTEAKSNEGVSKGSKR